MSAGRPSNRTPPGSLVSAEQSGLAGQFRAIVLDRPEGAVLSVHASPKSSVNQIGPIEDDTLKIRLTALPIEGAANAALIRLLADAASVPKSTVAVIAGSSARRKRVLFRGLRADELIRRLSTKIG